MTTPKPPRIVEHVVRDEDAGERADVVLGRRVPALSRRVARALARAGQLRIDGRRAAPSTRVLAGQRLALELDRGEDRAEEPLAELEILAKTERFIYVRKPAGVHTVALTPAQPGVLATAVAARFPECASASEDPREGGAVHRLDRPTSGVVAFARSAVVWRQARAGFRDERVAKHYLAVSTSVEGGPSWPPELPEGGLHAWIERRPPVASAELDALLEPLIGPDERVALDSVRIRAALGRDGKSRTAVRLDGQRAATLVSPLARRGPHLLLRLALETGRRHQARVHLAWIGLPIHGDAIYGAGPPGARLHLHAFALDLSAVFEDEAAVLAGPGPGFWPPEEVG